MNVQVAPLPQGRDPGSPPLLVIPAAAGDFAFVPDFLERLLRIVIHVRKIKALALPGFAVMIKQALHLKKLA